MPARPPRNWTRTFWRSHSRATTCSPRSAKSSTGAEAPATIRGLIAPGIGRDMFPRIPLALALASALLLTSPVAPIAALQADRFTLGVMRRDGVVLPFAAYDGNWSTPWPVSLRTVDVPI